MKKRRILGMICLLMALIMTLNHQFDFIGRFNTWLAFSDEPSLSAKDESSVGNSADNIAADDSVVDNPFRSELDKWHAANPHVSAWIDISGVLSTPVVQGGDNEYYLSHDATTARNRNGAAFIDYEVPEKDADNVVVYGHNMENTQVFSALDQYLNQDFALQHRHFHYATQERLWDAEVVSVCVMNLESKTEYFPFNMWLQWQNEKNAVSYLKGLTSSCRFRLDTPVGKRDRLLTLSTCDNSQTDARILVVAKLKQAS